MPTDYPRAAERAEDIATQVASGLHHAYNAGVKDGAAAILEAIGADDAGHEALRYAAATLNGAADGEPDPFRRKWLRDAADILENVIVAALTEDTEI